MIAWCSYCQEYVGEKEPFEDYSFTHGICRKCEEKEIAFSDSPQAEEQLARARKVRDLYDRLRALLIQGASAEFTSGCQQMLRLGLRPIDLVIGIMQPLLYSVGQLWASGKICPADEHFFTDVTRQMVSTMHGSLAHLQQFRQSSNPEILLAMAPGNSHCIGIQLVEILLMLQEKTSYTILRPLPSNELIDTLLRLKAENLGLTFALGSDLRALESLLDEIEREPGLEKLKIFVGGSAFRDSPTFQISANRAKRSTAAQLVEALG